MRTTLDLAIAFQGAGWKIDDVGPHVIRMKRGDIAVTVDSYASTDGGDVYSFNCDFQRNDTPSVELLEALHASLTTFTSRPA